MIVALMVVAASMSVAFAEPTDTTLKVNVVEGHKYTAYQLFVGDLSTDQKTLSNVKWGSDVKTTEITYNTNKKVTPVAGEAVPQDVLDYFETLSSANASDAAQATADIISAFVDTTKTGTALSASDTTVKTGYYVIVDEYTDATADHNTTLSTNVVAIVGPTTIAPKAGTTTHEKDVLDINDTTDTALDLTGLKDIDSGWDKSADHDFGDKVPFRLTTTIADDFAKYDAYKLVINDTLGNGLKLNKDSIKVYVDGTEKTVSETATDDAPVLAVDGQTFTITFSKLNAINANMAGKKVEVFYTATLDKDSADIGEPGNKNESWVEFSNNPNDEQNGTTTTPKVTVVVFTYKTVVNKVDSDKQPLKGAEFTLTKKLKNGSTATIAVLRYDKDGKAVATASTACAAADGTTFSFDGLDDGVYTLTETVTPNGYNTIDPITFKVTATHTASGISELSVTKEDGTAFNSDEIEFTITKAEGSMETTVVNNEGSTLPSTGGIGTTIFYVAGGILVLAAAILLVTKRRMGSEE